MTGFPKVVAMWLEEGSCRLIRAIAPRAWRPFIALLSRRESREQAATRDADSYGSLVRLYAHALEKACQCPEFDSMRGDGRARKLRDLLEARHADRVDAVTREWAEQMLKLYDDRVREPHAARKDDGFVGRTRHDAGRLLEFLHTRRSIRHFSTAEVTEDHFAVAVQCVRRAPTSCHRQAVRIYATNRPAIAQEAHSCCVGRSCFGNFIPGFAAICTDTNPYAMPDEFPLIYVDGAICAAFFVLGCHAQGLSATLMAWSSIRQGAEAQLRRLLAIPGHYEIVVTCALGFPGIETPSPPRKPLSEWLVMRNASG